MTTQVRQQLKVITQAINGKFWRLAGPQNKRVRAMVIEILTGEKPKASDCGINRLMVLAYEKFEIVGTCEADKESKLAAAILA